MTEIVYHHSAGGLIFRSDCVLVIHWDEPRCSYDFPKGHVEDNELPEQTAVREVYEETGYKTKIIAPIGQTYYEFDWIDGTYIKKTVDYYLLERLDNDEPHPQREAHETFENVWLPIDKAALLLTRDSDKDLLQKAVDIRRAFSSTEPEK